MTILGKIIEYKRKEILEIKESTPVIKLEGSRFFNRNTVSLTSSLLDKDKTSIIAEFKRKSPSKGIINSQVLVQDVAPGYEKERASGISVLTDNYFFGGSTEDLINAREKCHSPILRKDFTVSDYQVIESKSIGSDAILLIAAVLTKSEILDLARLARSLGLEVLLEIHDEEELDKANQFINIIGVNNRNLKTFDVDTDISMNLAGKIPCDFLKISESGISSTSVIRNLEEVGYNGFLIGERFMSSTDPVKAFSAFVKELNR